jgi:hypothetical protein
MNSACGERSRTTCPERSRRICGEHKRIIEPPNDEKKLKNIRSVTPVSPVTSVSPGVGRVSRLWRDTRQYKIRMNPYASSCKKERSE